MLPAGLIAENSMQVKCTYSESRMISEKSQTNVKSILHLPMKKRVNTGISGSVFKKWTEIFSFLLSLTRINFPQA